MTPITAEEITALWQRTAVPNEQGATTVCATGVTAADSDVVVGVDYLARRHLMVPLSNARALSVTMRASGIRVTAPRELLLEGRSVYFLDVFCTRHELSNAFARLAADLINEAAKSLSDPAGRCVAILESWKGLFGAGSGTFGRDQAVGLIGELWLLGLLAAIDPAAVELWTGPLGGIHDFRNNALAVEVKTSVRRHGRFHTVNSVDQLDIPAKGRLALLSLQLEAVPNGPLSLTDQLAGLATAGVSAQALEKRLTELGCTPGQLLGLENERYQMREVRFYEVDADFPRITRGDFTDGDLPNGVLSLRYDIDISGEPPAPLTQAAMEEWLTAFTCPPQR